MRLLEPKLCGRKVLDFRSIALSLSLCLLLSLSLSLPLSPCSFVSSFCIFLCFLSLLSILLSYVPLCVFMVLEVAIVSIHLLMLFMTFLNFEKVWICQGHRLFFCEKVMILLRTSWSLLNNENFVISIFVHRPFSAIHISEDLRLFRSDLGPNFGHKWGRTTLWQSSLGAGLRGGGWEGENTNTDNICWLSDTPLGCWPDELLFLWIIAFRGHVGLWWVLRVFLLGPKMGFKMREWNQLEAQET